MVSEYRRPEEQVGGQRGISDEVKAAREPAWCWSRESSHIPYSQMGKLSFPWPLI